MLINLRNALMAGKRTPTAKDYVQDGLVAMWDGIENAGWGTHADTLPVKYGMSNLCNLVSPTIGVDGVDYDFGLNVSGMTVEPDGLSWSDTSAWAAWGYSFNTSQIPVNASKSYISGAFPTNADTGQELTLEIVARLDTEGAPVQTIIVAGFNERAIYASYNANGNGLIRWNRNGGNQYEPFQSPFASGRAQTISLVQSPNGTNTVYVDGSPVLVRTGVSGYFLNNMFTFLRVNDVRHPWSPSGKFHNMRVSNRALTAAEIAANYAIDKARFNLP